MGDRLGPTGIDVTVLGSGGSAAQAVPGGCELARAAGWCGACGVLAERAVVGCRRCRLRGRIWSSEYLEWAMEDGGRWSQAISEYAFEK